MIKRVAIVLLVLFGAVLGLMFLPPLMNREPKYQGKPLSDWFKKYYRTGDFGRRGEESENKRAARALRAMGTAAVPWLVAQALSTNQNSQLETNVLTLLGNVPFFPPFVSADAIRWSAWGAVVEIKPPARLLLPLVTNAFNSFDRDQQTMTIGLFEGIGDGAEAAVPFLRERLRRDDFTQRRLAVRALERFGPAATAAVPDLIELVEDVGAGRQMHNLVYRALGNIGADASDAVPILRERMTTDTNVWMRMEIATVLWRIDPHESQALGLLTEQVKNTKNRDHRWLIIKKFGEVGPNAKAAVPFLLELLTDPNQLTWQPAAESLLKIGETNLALVGALKKLNADGFHNRLEAAKLILGVQPTNTAAMATLVELMKDGFSGYEAIKLVGNLNLDSKAAVLALREIANGTFPSHYRKAARQVLQEIEIISEEKRNAR